MYKIRIWELKHLEYKVFSTPYIIIEKAPVTFTTAYNTATYLVHLGYNDSYLPLLGPIAASK